MQCDVCAFIVFYFCSDTVESISIDHNLFAD